MSQDFGNELLRDQCPQKYHSKSSLYKDIIPVIIAAVIVSFFMGNLLESSGLNWLFSGIKNRLSKTYISVREKGICGIYAVNGYHNAAFLIPYEDIRYVSYHGEKAILETRQGKFTFLLEHASETVALICKLANI